MLLAIDIGNSNIVVGVYKEDELAHKIRLTTDKTVGYTECSENFLKLIQEKGLNFISFSGAIISSVVPSLSNLYVDLIRKHFNINPIIVSNKIKTNMPFIIDSPDELGADRIVNAVAAFREFNKSVIAVDFGTATTFDCVSDGGEYIGGIIAPGVILSLKALSQNASKLPNVELRKPKNLIGRNTVECMQSGLIYGYSSMVDGLILKLKREIKSGPSIIATGGLASLIAKETEYVNQIDEDLTLKGLKFLYDLNS